MGVPLLPQVEAMEEPEPGQGDVDGGAGGWQLQQQPQQQPQQPLHVLQPAVGVAAAPPAAATAPAAVMLATGEPYGAMHLPPTALPPPPPPPPRLIMDNSPSAPWVVSASTTAISLQWEPVRSSVESVVPVAIEFTIKYELQMQPVDSRGGGLDDGRWSVQYRDVYTSVLVNGLRPGRTYGARVIALPHVTSMMEVVAQPSLPSETVLVQTEPCPPMGQPAPELVSRAKKELKFKWAEPEESGGRPLHYVLQMTPAPQEWPGTPNPDGFFDMYQGTEHSYVAKRLEPGVQYCCRVKAINCEGESDWSPLAVFYTQSTVPTWPANDEPFVYDKSDSSVTLGWCEPANNGGTVSGYEVEMDDGSGFRLVARTTERHCMVQGLRSGILYRFRVRAENEAGRSLWSPVGEGRTEAVAPGTCSTPAVMGTSQTSLSVRWEGPEVDGGSPVQYYQVQVRPRCPAARRGLADDWVITYEGPDQACTIGGLRAGCSYIVRVAAANEKGLGPFSSAANLQTAPQAPDSPGAPYAVERQQTELSIAWPAPEHDGGSRIGTYRLEMCCVGSTDGPRGDGGKGKCKLDPPYELKYLGPECSTVVTGLEPGHRYAFRSSAINDQGSSGWGPVAHVDTLPGLPFPVDSLHLVQAASTSIKLRWSHPYGQGAAVTGYVLEMAEAAALLPPQPSAAQAQQQQAEAAGSEAAEQQQQQQQEAEAEAEGEPGAQHDQVQANGVPAGGDAEAQAEAAAAAAAAVFQPAYQGAESSCTVSGLQPHTTYVFRVRAYNCVGSSLSEQEMFRTAAAPPSCPLAAQQLEATPSSLRLSWEAPAADHGAAITSYQLECARGSRPAAAAWRLAYQGSSTHAQVEGLDAGSRYLVRARAGNACGWGPWCEPLPCSTAPDRPAAPAPLLLKAVGTAVRASWEVPEDNGTAIQAYELQMAPAGGGADFVTVFSGEATAHRVQQLEASTAYQFRVRAVNAVGAGPYSQVASVHTSKAPPPPPTAVEARLLADSSSIEVSWTPAQQGAQQAACISYEVEAASAGPSSAVRQSCPGRTTQVVLTGLQPGATYMVRARSVGADGAGHGAWSQPSERVTIPQQQRSSDATAAAAAPTAGADEGDNPSSRAQKRRERGGGTQARTTAAVKTSAAKGPPKKSITAGVSRWLKQATGLSLQHVFMFLAVAVAVVMLLLSQPALLLIGRGIALLVGFCMGVCIVYGLIIGIPRAYKRYQQWVDAPPAAAPPAAAVVPTAHTHGRKGKAKQ